MWTIFSTPFTVTGHNSNSCSNHHGNRWAATAVTTALAVVTVSAEAIAPVLAQPALEQRKEYISPEPSAPSGDRVVPNAGRLQSNLLYTPPDGGDAPRGGTTSSNGTRGSCNAASTSDLLPFAPQTHMGQTLNTQPTFVWYTPESDQTYTVEFRIGKHLVDDPKGSSFELIYETDFDSTDHVQSSGITAFSLEDTDVHLSPDSTYRWQVVLVCDPNRPSTSLIAEADIVVLDAGDASNAARNMAIQAATTPAERITAYANSQLWYDALAETFRASGTADMRIRLLEDLAHYEQQEEEKNAGNVDDEDTYSDRLRHVIDLIR